MIAYYPPETLTIALLVTATILAIIISFVVTAVLSFFDSKFYGANKFVDCLKRYSNSFLKILPPLIGYSIPISIIGYLAGYLTAYSRTGAVGNVLPAIIAIIGGLNVYIFGSDARYKSLVAYCACLLTVMLFYGAEYGAYTRDRDQPTRLEELTRQELKLRTMRKNLGMPEDFPAWIISTEPK
jgi:UDP-N-acetylmuramyl pentapeptide phosphotransferase/UDP-N-acetylglucosamine-1-phosphate transferase